MKIEARLQELAVEAGGWKVTGAGGLGQTEAGPSLSLELHISEAFSGFRGEAVWTWLSEHHHFGLSVSWTAAEGKMGLRRKGVCDLEKKRKEEINVHRKVNDWRFQSGL